ncbi:hypothetical protein Leryth_003020 [Lithospermum erythrorhizon]|nr:hypothetical protein Leryth_003020 [Lithospermum erythrorhizon]
MNSMVDTKMPRFLCGQPQLMPGFNVDGRSHLETLIQELQDQINLCRITFLVKNVNNSRGVIVVSDAAISRITACFFFLRKAQIVPLWHRRNSICFGTV